jgi:hypothetical protein
MPLTRSGSTACAYAQAVRRVASAFVLGTSLLVACAARPSGNAEASLHEAAERTLAQESFHMVVSFDLGAERGQATVEFVAPDRARITSPESIDVAIGDDRYVESTDPERCLKIKSPPGEGLSDILLPLELSLESEDVTGSGDTYEFEGTFDSSGTRFEAAARTQGGLIAWVDLRSELAGEVARTQYRLSGFGTSDTSIEPPRHGCEVVEGPSDPIEVGAPMVP